jgi:hypothetical protein
MWLSGWHVTVEVCGTRVGRFEGEMLRGAARMVESSRRIGE